MCGYVLVTGSAALVAHPSTMEWAHYLLHEHFVHTPRQSIVLLRAASVVERWAGELAHACGLHVMTVSPDGWRYSTREDRIRWSKRPLSVVHDDAVTIAAMLRMVRQAREDWSAEVLALGAPWCPPTDRLLMFAKAAGLPIDRRTYQGGDVRQPRAAELSGPKGKAPPPTRGDEARSYSSKFVNPTRAIRAVGKYPRASLRVDSNHAPVGVSSGRSGRSRTSKAWGMGPSSRRGSLRCTEGRVALGGPDSYRSAGAPSTGHGATTSPFGQRAHRRSA